MGRVLMLPHRSFIPYPNKMAVRVSQLGTVSPIKFLRRMDNPDLKHSADYSFHLRSQPQIDYARTRGRIALYLFQKEREAIVILHAGHTQLRVATFRDFIQFSGQSILLPSARGLPIPHRNPDVIKFHHQRDYRPTATLPCRAVYFKV